MKDYVATYLDAGSATKRDYSNVRRVLDSALTGYFKAGGNFLREKVVKNMHGWKKLANSHSPGWRYTNKAYAAITTAGLEVALSRKATWFFNSSKSRKGCISSRHHGKDRSSSARR